jgi:hypothetical protein
VSAELQEPESEDDYGSNFMSSDEMEDLNEEG